MTSCVGSFGHGANDLGNAIGPFSVIYYTWKNSAVAGKSSPVEVWMLAYGAITLCVGLATYGYHTMAILGNRITLMSPSRGFCMELGSAITYVWPLLATFASTLADSSCRVILASQYGIPTSTTMCIVRRSRLGSMGCLADWAACATDGWHDRCRAHERRRSQHQLAHDPLDLLRYVLLDCLCYARY